jgi:glycosyltransferase involved in cell wall biosynthesis
LKPYMNQSEPELSVVVPLHNEEGNAAPLCEAIRAALEPLGRPYEVLLVDDGSMDRTSVILEAFASAHQSFRLLRFDANYGQSAALTAGFQAARGRYVLTMDGDLQNDPADFPRLLKRLEDGGFSVVSGWRENRKGNLALRVIPSRAANRLISWISGLSSRDNGCSVKVYRAEVVKRAMLPHGFHRFLPAVFGVRSEEFAQIPVSDRNRHSGQGHYGLSRFFAVVRDLLVLRQVMSGNARVWLPVTNGVCFVAAFFALCAFRLWLHGHATMELYGGIAAGLIFAYGLAVRDGLIRWLDTQATPPYRLREGERTPFAPEEIAAIRERVGTAVGGVQA